ncbi:MAG: DUF4442 domain-containing protein [Flavobacteriales bacterium]|nr:DUF4442 domain-containing protein [Flavobacteriales bacterium]
MKLTPKGEKYINRIQNSFLFNLFLLKELPLAWVAGCSLKKITPEACQIRMPFGWRNQNPFKSIYFAAQSMSAEMSTGMLAVLAIENSNESIAMLVSNIEGEFTKKANASVTFTCEDGQKMFDAITETCKTGEAVLVPMKTVGRMDDGTEVSNWTFTWSVKKRSRK